MLKSEWTMVCGHFQTNSFRHAPKDKVTSGVNPTKLFFFVKLRFFPFFAVTLGHFKVHTIFSCATNTQA